MKQKFSNKDIIFTILFIVQFSIIFLINKELELTIIFYLEYILWGLSIYLGLISFSIFKKKGEVEKGKSYLNMRRLVEKCPYAIIRHPLYLAGIFLTISITMWTQVMISLIISVILIILTYHWTYSEEKILI